MVTLENKKQEAKRRRSPEAHALERVALAAREVQTTSTALERHYSEEGARQPSLLELARFSAAMQELKDAREAFDRLIIDGGLPRS
jgi:hypothetical protein